MLYVCVETGSPITWCGGVAAETSAEWPNLESESKSASASALSQDNNPPYLAEKPTSDHNQKQKPKTKHNEKTKKSLLPNTGRTRGKTSNNKQQEQQQQLQQWTHRRLSGFSFCSPLAARRDAAIIDVLSGFGRFIYLPIPIHLSHQHSSAQPQSARSWRSFAMWRSAACWPSSCCTVCWSCTTLCACASACCWRASSSVAATFWRPPQSTVGGKPQPPSTPEQSFKFQLYIQNIWIRNDRYF